MEIPKEVVVAIIGAIPALAAPLVSSLIQRQGDAQKTRGVELLEKRVQIIERLLSLDKYLSNDRAILLQEELDDIAQDLIADRVKERLVSGVVVDKISTLRRFLLIYEQPTIKASVYRGFFWFFCFITTVGGTSVLLLGSEFYEYEIMMTTLFGLIFYGGIGLLFRSAAIRQQKKLIKGDEN